jgi:hypothetical protein
MRRGFAFAISSPSDDSSASEALRGRHGPWSNARAELALPSIGHLLPSERISPNTPKQGGSFMGDKSPKAKDKSKKQDTANKNQKKAAADAKAKSAPAAGAKKGK